MTTPDTPVRTGPGRPPIYPWDEWLDGQAIRHVRRGREFTCEVASFLQLLRRTAKKRGATPRYQLGKGISHLGEIIDGDENDILIWAEPSA